MNLKLIHLHSLCKGMQPYWSLGCWHLSHKRLGQHWAKPRLSIQEWGADLIATCESINRKLTVHQTYQFACDNIWCIIQYLSHLFSLDSQHYRLDTNSPLSTSVNCFLKMTSSYTYFLIYAVVKCLHMQVVPTISYIVPTCAYHLLPLIRTYSSNWQIFLDLDIFKEHMAVTLLSSFSLWVFCCCCL